LPNKTMASAKAEAKKKGFSESSITKGEKGYYLAPHGVTTAAGKKTYANARDKGMSQESAAKISHSVDKKAKSK